jgi:hypothetical protein
LESWNPTLLFIRLLWLKPIGFHDSNPTSWL